MTQAKTAARYAEGTQVEVPKTRGEIEGLFVKHGATQSLTGADHANRSGFVAFVMKGRHYRLNVPPAPAPEPQRGRRGFVKAKAPEQLERERWRALLLIVKAKLEIIRAGMATVEQEFLANTVLPDGSLVGDSLGPALDQMYATGKMLPLLPGFPALPPGIALRSDRVQEGELEDP
jgi:hypothetical protein